MQAPETNAGATKARGRQPSPVPALALLAVTLLLPALSLIPLGSLWLWQNGYVLYWAIATCLVVTLSFILLRRMLRPLADMATPASPDTLAKPIWNAREEAAWKDVLELARTTDPQRLSGREEVIELGLETITQVAHRMHPDRSDPLLRFTLPEAFAVVEEASAGLRAFVENNLPFGDRITVAQIMWLYRWRTALPLIEKGFDLWRLVRLVNPLSAATQELRERATRQLYDMGRAHIARRLTEAFVREVGKAAIDLYGGNLRVSSARLAQHVSDATRRDTQVMENVAAEPLRILVAGQSGAGKSSLINALTGSVEATVDVLPSTGTATAYRITREGLPQALLIDTPGLQGGDAAVAALLEAARDCDMVIWTLSAARAARALDRSALEALQARYAALGSHPPPVVVALTQIDRLRPFADWNPPYDVAAATTPKAKSIRGAIDAVAGDLPLPDAAIVPLRTDSERYNIEMLWAEVLAALPEAKRSRLQRCLRGADNWSWRSVLSQAAGAGRVLSRTILERSDKH